MTPKKKKENNIPFKDTYKLIVEKMNEGVLLHDQNGKITFVNPRTLELLNYKDANELIGKNYKITLPETEHEKVEKETNRRESGIGSTYESMLLTKDNISIPAIISTTPIFEEGIYKGVVSVFTDISKRKIVEEELEKRRSEMELFLDVLTHDLLNYQQKLVAFLDLTEFSDQEDYPKIIKNIRTIQTLSNHLLMNVSILMRTNLSFTYELEPVSVLNTLKEVNDTLKVIYPDKKIILKTRNISPDVYIRADALFEQLLLNLLTNSVKYTENTEQIEIEISLTKGKDKVCKLIVSDQAKGIAPQDRESIFERFGKFREKGSGIGLGLRIVKTLVERYNGKITIENRVKSNYRLGTKFVLELNLA